MCLNNAEYVEYALKYAEYAMKYANHYAEYNKKYDQKYVYTFLEIMMYRHVCTFLKMYKHVCTWNIHVYTFGGTNIYVHCSGLYVHVISSTYAFPRIKSQLFEFTFKMSAEPK
jgi:hypothetical protein